MKAKIIATNNVTDLWLIGDQCYFAPNGCQMDVHGLPQGARWECSLNHYKRYAQTKVFNWLAPTVYVAGLEG